MHISIESSSNALAFLSEARQSVLFALRPSHGALTRGGLSGLPRPIELHARDPIRYAGDMLASVHEAVPAEYEFLEGLFGVGGRMPMVGAVGVRKGVSERVVEFLLWASSAGVGMSVSVSHGGLGLGLGSAAGPGVQARMLRDIRSTQRTTRMRLGCNEGVGFDGYLRDWG